MVDGACCGSQTCLSLSAYFLCFHWFGFVVCSNFYIVLTIALWTTRGAAFRCSSVLRFGLFAMKDYLLSDVMFDEA